MKLPTGTERIEEVAFSFPADTAVSDLAVFIEHASVHVDVNRTEVFRRAFKTGELELDCFPGEALSWIFDIDRPATSDDEITVRIECPAGWVVQTGNGLLITARLSISGKNQSGNSVTEWIN